MSQKVYYIGARWDPVGPRFKAVEEMLDQLGDWVRFNDSTWFLSTSRPSAEVDGALQRLLTTDATMLVIALDPKDRFGWAPAWLWEWIDGQRQEPPKTAEAILRGRTLPGRGDDRASSRVGEAAGG